VATEAAVVAIHQPEHLPWLGFFHKMLSSDVFVLLDNVPFRKNYFQNRNRLRGARGPVWITVPVLTKGRSGQLISQVQINPAERRWGKRLWHTLRQCYGRAPFFAHYGPALEELYCHRQWQLLAELNVALIELLRQWLGIGTRLLRASELPVSGSSTLLLWRICRHLGAGAYLSGSHGPQYLDEGPFRQAGIEVLYQDFRHPRYRQLYEPFIPQMSALDLLMNHGPRSLDILRGKGG